MKRLHFPNALVTGASSGIGRAFAHQLAARGSDLVLVARRRDRLDALAVELHDRYGRRAEVLDADLSDRGQLAGVEARLGDGTPPVDLLVNGAGFGSHGAFASLPLEREAEEISLNVVAPVRLMHAALPGMLKRGSGGVVNVSSIAGLQPLPYNATYAATKSYLTSFSVAVHEEVRARGVCVLALMPGFTHTEFHDQAGIPKSVAPKAVWMSAERVVACALRDLDHGRATSVPGRGYRAFSVLTRVMPWTLSRRVVERAGRHRAADRS